MDNSLYSGPTGQPNRSVDPAANSCTADNRTSASNYYPSGDLWSQSAGRPLSGCYWSSISPYSGSGTSPAHAPAAGGTPNAMPVASSSENSCGGTEWPGASIDPSSAAAYLSGHLGSRVRAEFLVGDRLAERSGILVEVGPSHIILESAEHTTMTYCDLNCLRFASIVPSAALL